MEVDEDTLSKLRHMEKKSGYDKELILRVAVIHFENCKGGYKALEDLNDD